MNDPPVRKPSPDPPSRRAKAKDPPSGITSPQPPKHRPKDHPRSTALQDSTKQKQQSPGEPPSLPPIRGRKRQRTVDSVASLQKWQKKAGNPAPLPPLAATTMVCSQRISHPLEQHSSTLDGGFGQEHPESGQLPSEVSPTNQDCSNANPPTNNHAAPPDDASNLVTGGTASLQNSSSTNNSNPPSKAKFIPTAWDKEWPIFVMLPQAEHLAFPVSQHQGGTVRNDPVSGAKQLLVRWDSTRKLEWVNQESTRSVMEQRVPRSHRGTQNPTRLTTQFQATQERGQDVEEKLCDRTAN